MQKKKNTQPFSPCEDVIRNLQPRNAPSSCQADTLPSASPPGLITKFTLNESGEEISSFFVEMFKEPGVPTTTFVREVQSGC